MENLVRVLEKIDRLIEKQKKRVQVCKKERSVHSAHIRSLASQYLTGKYDGEIAFAERSISELQSIKKEVSQWKTT